MSIDTILYSAYSILYACVYVYICYIDDVSEDDIGIPAGLAVRAYIFCAYIFSAHCARCERKVDGKFEKYLDFR